MPKIFCTFCLQQKSRQFEYIKKVPVNMSIQIKKNITTNSMFFVSKKLEFRGRNNLETPIRALKQIMRLEYVYI